MRIMRMVDYQRPSAVKQLISDNELILNIRSVKFKRLKGFGEVIKINILAINLSSQSL